MRIINNLLSLCSIIDMTLDPTREDYYQYKLFAPDHWQVVNWSLALSTEFDTYPSIYMMEQLITSQQGVHISKLKRRKVVCQETVHKSGYWFQLTSFLSKP